jgi:hypothetical protein
MLRSSTTACFLFVTALLSRASFGEAPDAGDDFQWRDDLEGARKTARELHKPLLIVFR